MTIVWLLRHAQAEKAPGQSPDDLFSVAQDPGLSEHGVEQARAAAERLAKEHFDIVVSSPAKRAIETARIVGRCEPTIDARFAEWIVKGADYEETLRGILDLPRKARLGPLFPRERLAYSEGMKEIASKHACALVVSHALANRGFLCRARNIPLPELMTIEQEHATVVRCEWRAGTWRA